MLKFLYELSETSNAQLIFTEKGSEFLAVKINEELVDEVCNMLKAR